MKLDHALYIVATPIGNLNDMSFRAVETLKAVDFIAAEDTRHSARLMQHFNIETPMITYHDHSSESQVSKLLDRLHAGKSMALISDAGTPLISDPGYRLVQSVRAAGYKVVPVPGACAVIAALSASGLPSDRFSFEGFTPAKSAARKSVFTASKYDLRTLIYYESPHRIIDSLSDMIEVFGEDRFIVLAREITKTYETFLEGTVVQVLDRVRADMNQQKGEMVLLVSAYQPPKNEGIGREAEEVMAVLLEQLPVKQASALASKITGVKKNQLYQWALTDES